MLTDYNDKKKAVKRFLDELCAEAEWDAPALREG